jgi:AcrR family transcriptional regulator
MTSLRHNTELGASAADLALDAARASILDVGWSGTTLTGVARRAGVSRMTIYRRWPDMGSLLADLMTREWTELVPAPPAGTTLAGLVEGVVATVRAVRANHLFARIVELDPERLLPYLLERPGRSQALVVGALVEQLRAAQAAGEVREEDPQLLARSIVLTCHGFMLSAATMTRPGVSVAALDEQLSALLEGYLRPRTTP